MNKAPAMSKTGVILTAIFAVATLTAVVYVMTIPFHKFNCKMTVGFQENGVTNCPKGWVAVDWRACIRLEMNAMTFHDAKAACKGHGGQLVSLNSEGKQDAVLAYLFLENTVDSNVWTAGQRIPSAGNSTKFLWPKGGSLKRFSNWAKDAKGTGDCVQILSRNDAEAGQWSRCDCGLKRPFLCEMGVGSKVEFQMTGGCDTKAKKHSVL